MQKPSPRETKAAGHRRVLILTPDRPTNHHILWTLGYHLKEVGLEPELKGGPLNPTHLAQWVKEQPGPVPLILALCPVPGEKEKEERRWREWADHAGQLLQEMAGLFASVHVACWGGANTRLPARLVSLATYELDRHEDLDRLVRDVAASLAVPPPPHAEGSAKAPADGRPAVPAVDLQYTSVADVPARQDAAGFTPYVDAIARFLSDPKTHPPLTLAIEGEWGSGKSSFMLQLEQALRRSGARKFVWFNAWRFDKDEALWASFALEFARQVSPRRLPARLLKRLTLAVRRLLSGQGWLGLAKVVSPLLLLAVASWLRPKELANWDELVKSLAAVVLAPLSVPFVQRLWKFVGNPFSVDLKKIEEAPSYESRIPFLQQFHEDFQLITETYIGEDEKVFVFIDDLDRCEVPKAAELLQALNLMIGDSPKLIFILGVDQEKVAAGIAIRNEKLLPLLAPLAADSPGRLSYDPVKALEFGYDFLERFIQLPFQIPRLTDHLDPMLDLLLGVPRQDPADPALALLPGKSEAPVGRSAPAPESKPLRPEDVRRRAFMLQQAEVDSPEIRAAMKMVAPAFGNNPRRLKKFLNVFRLSTYIASETGLFDLVPEHPPLTLSKLAKFIALVLRWPRFCEDLEAHPALLQELLASDPEKPSEATAHWREHRPLVELLAHGVAQAPETYALDRQDFERLRSVAPAAQPLEARDALFSAWREEKQLAG